jgi:hypothetical protein
VARHFVIGLIGAVGDRAAKECFANYNANRTLSLIVVIARVRVASVLVPSISIKAKTRVCIQIESRIGV